MQPHLGSFVPYEINATQLVGLPSPPTYLKTKRTEVRIGEPALAAIMLVLLTRLQELKFSAIAFEDDYQSDIPSILDAFGISVTDVVSVPAFANLRHVSIQEGSMKQVLIALPSLVHLTLSLQVTIKPPPQNAPFCNANFVTLDSGWVNWSGEYHLSSFLGLLPNLCTLELCFIEANSGFESLDWPEIGKFMQNAMNVDESLLIWGNEVPPDWPRSTRESLKEYTQLTIAENVVLKYGREYWDLEEPVTLLPPNLETLLIISHASERVFPWLEKLSSANFATLRRVELHALSKKELASAAESTVAARELRTKGIELIVRQH